MKKTYHVVINWRKNSPASMLKVAALVSEKMQDNENFKEPAVPMPDFNKTVARLQAAYNNRSNGKLARIELEAAGTDMDAALRAQALYVTEASAYSNAIIETSGFTASKDTMTPAAEPAMPTDVKLTSKNNNVTLIAKKPKGAKTLTWVIYFGEVAGLVALENNLISVPAGVAAQVLGAGKAREVIAGLTAGTKVTVQVMAQNSAGCSALSECVTAFVNK